MRYRWLQCPVVVVANYNIFDYKTEVICVIAYDNIVFMRNVIVTYVSYDKLCYGLDWLWFFQYRPWPPPPYRATSSF